MSTNVYNIVWADDQIDDILDEDTLQDLKEKGFNIIGCAHNGEELRSILEKRELIDAAIVDANFNESDQKIESEQDTSGLDYSRSLYLHKLNRAIPFFLFTGRNDELLKEKYANNPKFLVDFPRHKRWFNKTLPGEFNNMLDEIKKAVDETKTPSFIVRNKYKDELAAAKELSNETYDFILNFLIRDHNNTLQEIKEPFITVRRTIEKIFGECEKLNLIPPISYNLNGTVYYFQNGKYDGRYYSKQSNTTYQMTKPDLMPKPLACALSYITKITQDASHSKDQLNLKVNEYFDKTQDFLLVRSVVYILMDIIKWYDTTALNNDDEELNEQVLWYEI